MNEFSVYAYCGFDLTAEERFKKIKEAGFDKTAVWCHTDFNTNSGISEYEQFKYLREQGLKLSYAHCPIKYAPYLANKYYGAKEAVKTHKIYVKDAKEQGVEIVVAHLPEVTPAVIDNVGEIAEFAAGQGVKIAFENLVGDKPFDELFRAVKDAYFCYDTCHALMFGDEDGQMAERYADRLIATHLSDGDGKKDCHFMLGKGVFNFSALAEKLKKLGYKGDYTLEAFQTPEYTDISDFLSDGKARLEQIFG
ncbi:MAG: sugar phosphate isomerase/epimerase [Clostridia bacterium]|nr:sugar phosphate isomerase/epimerase [Clostridia bacterium]